MAREDGMKVGLRVRITDGKCEGLEGTIVRVGKNVESCQVQVDSKFWKHPGNFEVIGDTTAGVAEMEETGPVK